MIECAWSGTNLHGKREREKRDAVEVMLTFAAPLPTRKAGNPSGCDCARALGVATSTLDCVDKHMIEKRRLLSAGEMGLKWALATKKKGYSTISNELKLLLLEAFNDHPHVIVSPNSKDTLQMTDVNREKVTGSAKIMTMVGMGTIFSDIIRDNPTIKKTVGEPAFHYIVSGLGCVRRFTDSYKTMCGCTECVGLQSLHRLLQAKRGVMHRQFATP